MGGRLLRGWLLRPLVALERIQDRLDAVEEFAFRSTERTKVRDTLKSIHDIERLVARAALGTAGPRDLVSLRQSIAVIPRIRMLLKDFQAPLIRINNRRASAKPGSSSRTRQTNLNFMPVLVGRLSSSSFMLWTSSSPRCRSAFKWSATSPVR